MIPVFVVQQRNHMKYAELHDSIDVRWPEFFNQAGLVPVLLPNNLQTAKFLLSNIQAEGAILSGGGDHNPSLEKDDRSDIERLVMDWSKSNGKPVIGVCRGMQAMMQAFGAQLIPCGNQVQTKQTINFMGQDRLANSYHALTEQAVPKPFEVIGMFAAVSEDSGKKETITKAVYAKSLNWLGIMWHPERLATFNQQDLDLFRIFIKDKKL